jgi:hypothetical protein
VTGRQRVRKKEKERDREHELSDRRIILHALDHRVGRVLSFFSSRRNWGSPNPSPADECAPPPPGSGWRGTFAGERGGWESPNSDEGTYTVVLFIYTYFVLWTVRYINWYGKYDKYSCCLPGH